MKKINNFLSNVNKELSKVRWSSKKEMLTYSSATLFFIFIFAIFFILTDMLLAFFKGLV